MWSEVIKQWRMLHCFWSNLSERDKVGVSMEVTIAGATTIYAIISLFQWCAVREANRINREIFQKTQQATVHLGLSDGKIADFLPGGDVLRILLFFRNTGPTTAQRTAVDIWPITTIPNKPPVVTKLLPPNKHTSGPSIPPGSPYTFYRPYRDATQEELDSGTKHLQIIGRVTYTDIFGGYCETFALDYNAAPLWQFNFTAYDGPDLCDEEEDTIESTSLTVISGPTTQLFPFSDPLRQNTKNDLQ